MEDGVGLLELQCTFFVGDLVPKRSCLVVSVAGFNHRSPTLISGMTEHTPVNFSNIVKPLLKTNNWANGRYVDGLPHVW